MSEKTPSDRPQGNPDRIIAILSSAKFKDISKYMPEADMDVIDFASFLAEYAHDQEVVPRGFGMFVEFALNDIETGTDWRTGKEHKRMGGHRDWIRRDILRMSAPAIAKALFGEEFGNEVASIYRKIYHERAEENRKKVEGTLK